MKTISDQFATWIKTWLQKITFQLITWVWERPLSCQSRQYTCRWFGNCIHQLNTWGFVGFLTALALWGTNSYTTWFDSISRPKLILLEEENWFPSSLIDRRVTPFGILRNVKVTAGVCNFLSSNNLTRPLELNKVNLYQSTFSNAS